jgi:predicted porin
MQNLFSRTTKETGIMRTPLAFAVLATASSQISAQTNVEVYGILDVGLSHVSGLRSGADKNMVASGIMDGSRLGFRGSEDLGGGYRALFTMEHRVEADNGTLSNQPPSGTQLPDRLASATLLGLPAAFQPVVDSVSDSLGNTVGVNLAQRFWDRQVYIGLVTPFGAVMAGRQYTPAYEISATFDTLGTQSSLAAGQVAAFPTGIDIRVSNAVQYRIQQGPYAASVMYAEGEQGVTGRLIGGMAKYKVDSFSLGVGYNTRENELGEKSLTTLVVGASAKLGPGSLFATYAKVDDENPTGLSGLPALLTPVVGPVNALFVQGQYASHLQQDANIYHVGYKYVIAQHTIYAAYTTLNDQRPDNADVASYGMVYSYAFSKRTDLNLVLTHFDNKDLAQAAPGGAGFVGGVTSSAGTDANNVALGMRHRF